MADTFCDDEQPDYVQQECGTELAGVVAVAFISRDVDVDTDNLAASLELESWWSGLLESSPKQAWIVLDTRGERPPGTPTEDDGFGLVPTERTGDDNEMTFDALGTMENRGFWASKNKRRGWKMVYLTASKDDAGNFEAFFIENVSVYASLNVQRSIKGRKFYTVSAKWSTDMTPDLPFMAPGTIFELSE